MGRIVIVGYRPKPGKAEKLRELMRTHVPRLRAEGMVTSRAPVIMQAEDGAFVEVFEWLSEEAIETAHSNAAVRALWAEFTEACDCVPVGSLAEAQQLFSGFAPVDFD